MQHKKLEKKQGVNHFRYGPLYSRYINRVRIFDCKAAIVKTNIQGVFFLLDL